MDTGRVLGVLECESDWTAYLTVSNGDKFVVVREEFVVDTFAVYTASAWLYRKTFGGINRLWVGYVPRAGLEAPTAEAVATLWYFEAYPDGDLRP